MDPIKQNQSYLLGTPGGIALFRGERPQERTGEVGEGRASSLVGATGRRGPCCPSPRGCPSTAGPRRGRPSV